MNAEPRTGLCLKVLAENTARGMGVLGEHGLAWWIETPTHRVLFDTGQGLVLASNARMMEADLAKLDAVLLSHGHLDHVGGLEAVLSAAPYASLHLHPDAVVRRYTGSDGKARRLSSGFMEQQDFMKDGRSVHMVKQPQEIAPGIWSTGEIPRSNDFEDTGGPFYLDENLTQPDPLLDDQAVFMHTRQGIVVILGCAHAGVVNTLSHIRTFTNGERIHALFGGMHLERASEYRLGKTVELLRALDIRRLGPNHCTGQRAVARFWSEFPDRMVQCSAGSRFEFA